MQLLDSIAGCIALLSELEQMFLIKRIESPYPSIDVAVSPQQMQFTSPVADALERMQFDEMAFAIFDSDLAVGFFTLRRSDSDVIEQLRCDTRLTLQSFMIDARQQGKGYAKKALDQLPFLSRQYFANIDSIGLSVNCRNQAAYRLYEKNGFRDIGELYYGGSAGPQHIMIRDL